MHQFTRVLRLFSKPGGEGYASQLPHAPSPKPGPLWRRASQQNSEVRDFFSCDAVRYEEWYKETYGVEDTRDGSAASGASSNRRLSDEKNLNALHEYDFEFSKRELQHWSSAFHHNTQLS